MPAILPHSDTFLSRHIGPSPADVRAMLAVLGYPSLDALIDATVPASIRLRRPLDLPAPMSEQDALAALAAIVAPNEVWRSFIGALPVKSSARQADRPSGIAQR